MKKTTLEEPWRFILFASGLGFCVAAVINLIHHNWMTGGVCAVMMLVCWHYLGRAE